jgi:hypothetical protein
MAMAAKTQFLTKKQCCSVINSLHTHGMRHLHLKYQIEEHHLAALKIEPESWSCAYFQKNIRHDDFRVARHDLKKNTPHVGDTHVDVIILSTATYFATIMHSLLLKVFDGSSD